MTGEPGAPSYGRFVANVSLMWTRAQRPHAVTLPPTEPDARGPSAIDPDLALSNVVVAFMIGLHVPDARYVHTWDAVNPSATYRIALSDGNGLWASVRYASWDAPDAVRQWGTRRLWDESTSARGWWEDRGRPSLTRFGLTVTARGRQETWLDDPGRPVRPARKARVFGAPRGETRPRRLSPPRAVGDRGARAILA